MRSAFGFLPFLLAGLLSFTFLSPALRAQRGGFDADFREAARHGWISSYQEGLNQAARQRKPMMLVFRCVP